MTLRRSKSETEIPLFLVPHVIARQIKEQGDEVFRISVKRTHWHHYNVTVRTKPQNRELRVREDRTPSPEVTKRSTPDDKTADEKCGGVA